jgi:hypothetical protein
MVRSGWFCTSTALVEQATLRCTSGVSVGGCQVGAWYPSQHEGVLDMNKQIPAWALRAATAEDHGCAQEAHRHGNIHITWPNAKVVRIWAKHQGWPTPWFGFEAAFIATMLETKTNFELAIKKSGIEIHVPRQDYMLSAAKIRELDALYAQRSSSGRPNGWGSLVEELRAIRRAVEAGVVVTIEGEQPLLSWQHFYHWAHGRYHMLEDGYDKWIGDDS